MAASTDQKYRDQKALDTVFAVSCLLMLFGTIWMFVQDYNRPFKSIQRQFRDVEEAMAQRGVVENAPGKEALENIVAAEKAVKEKRKELNDVKDKNAAKVDELTAKKIKADDRYRGIKADYDSVVSLYDIAVDEQNAASKDNVDFFRSEVKHLNEEIGRQRAELAKAKNELDNATYQLSQAMKSQTDVENELSKADDILKKQTADFDRFQRLAESKSWGTGDFVRNLPILDAFASPTKIQQITLTDLPIDYAFKHVTRFDRCMTCHMGIDRAAYDKSALQALGQDPSDALKAKLTDAKRAVRARRKAGDSTLDPSDIALSKVKLTPAQVSQFAAHPRMDLFVDGNSPHSSEKFGCTICHGGQGSATDFLNADHTPNDTDMQDAWKKNHDWSPSHYWDYPMQPARFIESQCVKCHYQITDLIRDGSRNEAPHLTKGFNLVRDNGCFGCHEIAGIKGGRQIGPDLRLEPSPPLDAYTPAERVKLNSDPLNPPGTMRKVGPSLRRLSEKTNADWLVKWIRSPRTFRPDTKMPHFYGLSNNHPSILPEDQKTFPDSEIYAIAHYLLEESTAYVKGTDKFRRANEAKLKDLKQFVTDGTANELQVREIEEIERRLQLHTKVVPLSEAMKELPPVPADEAGKKEQQLNGRKLFSERGCLACHIHDGTTKPTAGNPGQPNFIPAINGEGQFGPNLSRLAAKLGTKPGDELSARRWLVQWIMDPTIYHPRTKMPVTHLTMAEANDVAGWLLSQKVKWEGPEVIVPTRENLTDLARVFLSRAYTRREVDRILEKGITTQELQDWGKPLDADERELEVASDDAKPGDNQLKAYIGKKAINQLGCFGCHDIPGFENAKPIGTPLNDWGKKDPDRLAFEDATSYVQRTYQIEPKLTDEKGEPVKLKAPGKKTLYEKYFADLLNHHQREGFLYQKLTDPRSFDFERKRLWDDRLRMPQFRFARVEPREGEDPNSDEFQARAQVEESEARTHVMTFILGLVAEPIPPKFVYQPPPDRAAEVKGRTVLEKFNCAGCHYLRAGTAEFKLNDESLKHLMSAYEKSESKAPADHFFKDSNAWNGTLPAKAGILNLYGTRQMMEIQDDAGNPMKVPGIRLTQALKFSAKDDAGKTIVYNIPAQDEMDIRLPEKLITGSENYGGTFANLLSDYLVATKANKADATADKIRVAVPPALLREGEKTQPVWLYQFLRNPYMIRPMTVLRMPKFNMSDDEAVALVNYFSAVDKVDNPALGVHYPYTAVPEKGDTYIRDQTAKYVARLKSAKQFDQRVAEMKPVWETTLAELKGSATGADARLVAVKKQVEETMEAVKNEQDAKKKKELEEKLMKLTDQRDIVQKEVEKAQADVKNTSLDSLQKQWEREEAYAVDAFKLIGSSGSPCIACHQIGNILPKSQQGPNLDLARERLRPEWTKHWIANPKRLMTYSSPMPANFPRDKVYWQEMFQGTSLEQVTAARDALMNFAKWSELPANRSRPVTVMGGGQ